MFEEVISTGIVSIVILMLFVTLPGEAPLKRLLSRPVVSRLFYYYVTFYLTFACIFLFWTISNWIWKSISFQSYSIISRLESRITKLFLLIILCIPSRYILRLMIVPPGASPNISSTRFNTYARKPHARGQSVPLTSQPVHKHTLRSLIFGRQTNSQNTGNDKRQVTPFQALETTSTLHNVSQWTPLPSEVFELSGLFQLFTKIRLHGLKHIPQNKPCMIVINHALGHGFDVPMMVYILRKYCNMPRVRVLVSPKHYNYPIWADLVYYLGGVPRTHQTTEHLMKRGENIIMFAAKKKNTSMIWDNNRRLYLDLVHKYDYKVVPAVCVSDDDVINMVYNFRVPSKQDSQSVGYDTDTDNEEEESKIVSFDIIKNRLRKGYRKQYHLRFSKAIGVPKETKRSTKKRKSTEYKMDDDDTDSISNISEEKSESDEDSVDSIDFGANTAHGRKRRWSRDLEVGLKNAVEDAMTDGISEMYIKLKNDPHSSLLQTMHKKMNIMSPATPSDYAATLQHDISNEQSSKGDWME
eukprot:418855_1